MNSRGDLQSRSSKSLSTQFPSTRTTEVAPWEQLDQVPSLLPLSIDSKLTSQFQRIPLASPSLKTRLPTGSRKYELKSSLDSTGLRREKASGNTT